VLMSSYEKDHMADGSPKVNIGKQVRESGGGGVVRLHSDVQELYANSAAKKWGESGKGGRAKKSPTLGGRQKRLVEKIYSDRMKT